ncbi:1-aminocyclopropane-1-carboxylate deaminase/D-cysteine desulfhydrase [Microbulbifer sp. CNSA002]|uniref:1-aminocyclopropane-1-carboxylate deaminase/D-cysteine desulfhydrase n=1 Tax=unclassified Microbulbifer TaxID=2619833 RepID=UPI0039B66AA0
MDFLERLDLKTFTEAARRVPYERVYSHLFPGIELWVRRDDRLDPMLSGNKAYKLLFSLLEARERGIKTVVTCGGAWSNHIHATAAAGARFGFSTLGVIRGERPSSLSATLQDAQRLGMKLVFVTRAQYRRRGEAEFLCEIGIDEESMLFVPEGGAGLPGVRGARLLGRVIKETSPVRFDQVWVASGTGATFAGLVAGLREFPVVGVEVLKAGGSIEAGVSQWLRELKGEVEQSIERVDTQGAVYRGFLGDSCCNLLSSFHCGGYGKFPSYLSSFLDDFDAQVGIPLDPVYTGKLFYALSKSASSGNIAAGSKVLVVHSGGGQGRRGYF